MIASKFIIKPKNAPRPYTSPKIDTFSFISGLARNKTKRPTPELVRSPPIKEPKEMAPFKYSSVIIILEPQFGIRPIRLVMKEPNTLSLKNILERASSPTYVKTIFTKNVVSKIKTNVLAVCLIEDANIPDSQ